MPGHHVLRKQERRGDLSENNGWPEFCCAQQRYSYVRPQAGAFYDPHVFVTDEHLDYCRSRDLTILAYSPLLGGAYVRDDRSFPAPYQGPDTDTRVETLKAVAGETGATANQAVQLTGDQLMRLSQAGNHPVRHPNGRRDLPSGAKEG